MTMSEIFFNMPMESINNIALGWDHTQEPPQRCIVIYRTDGSSKTIPDTLDNELISIQWRLAHTKWLISIRDTSNAQKMGLESSEEKAKLTQLIATSNF